MSVSGVMTRVCRILLENVPPVCIGAREGQCLTPKRPLYSLLLPSYILLARNIPLPIVCKDQGKRLVALCDYLLSEKYDIVALQEVCRSLCLWP